MKKERNELLEFLAGMAMLVVGLYLLTTRVEVTTGFWGWIYINSGLACVNWINRYSIYNRCCMDVC